MHAGAFARTSIDLDAATEKLLRGNVKLHTFSRYYLGPPARTGLIFGYGCVDRPQIKRGLAALREAFSAS